MRLENINDKQIIHEAIERLKERVKRKTGNEVLYGNFIVSLHEGKCGTIDFNLKDRCFTGVNTHVKGERK